MTISEDAAVILGYVYKEYEAHESNEIVKQLSGIDFLIRRDFLVEKLEMSDSRVEKAGKYLIEKKLVKPWSNMRADWKAIEGITPEGIDIAENKSKFKRTFGVELNLAFGKVKWEASEK